jgi:hypothetical protein
VRTSFQRGYQLLSPKEMRDEAEESVGRRMMEREDERLDGRWD